MSDLSRSTSNSRRRFGVCGRECRFDVAVGQGHLIICALVLRGWGSPFLKT